MTDTHGDGVAPQWFSVPPTQAPLSSQASLLVQNWPSSHVVPCGAATTTQVFSWPTYCPVLHTATLHCPVSNFEQSTPQGPRSAPPAPPPPALLELVLAVVLMGASPVAHATVKTTGRTSKTLKKS